MCRAATYELYPHEHRGTEIVEHAVVRTSDYGTPFVGKCIKCGKENLGLSGALEKCENTNYSNEQALLDIIEEVFNETK